MALNQNMLKCIEMLVYTDMRKQDIVKEIGVAPNAISRWMKKDEFQQALQEEMHRGFSSLAIEARKKLGTLINSNNDLVALGACKEVLNKAGYQETQKIEQKIDTDIVIEITSDKT